jgi:hypothetical protein
MHSNKNKEYRAKYLSDKRRREIVFSKAEYKSIEQKAKEYNRPVGEFLKGCIFSYLDNKFLLHDPNLYKALMLEIRRIGTNVNQISKRVNKKKSVVLFDTIQVSKGIKEIEVMVKNSLNKPPNLLDEIEKAIQDSNFLYQVEVLIYHQKIKNDSKIQSLEKGGI